MSTNWHAVALALITDARKESDKETANMSNHGYSQTLWDLAEVAGQLSAYGEHVGIIEELTESARDILNRYARPSVKEYFHNDEYANARRAFVNTAERI